MQLEQFAGLRRRAESVLNEPTATPATEGAGLSDESAPDSEAVTA